MNSICHTVLWEKRPAERMPSNTEAPQSFVATFKGKENETPEDLSHGVVVVAHPEDLRTPLSVQGSGYYIPGAFCRQGDILEAVKQTRKPVWIERGSFLSPRDMTHIVSRFEGSPSLTIVEAGSHMGYDDRVLDLRSLNLYETWGAKTALSLTDLVFGGTHKSSFRPTWEDDATLQESYIKMLLRISSIENLGLVIKSLPNPSSNQNDTRTFDLLINQVKEVCGGGPRP